MTPVSSASNQSKTDNRVYPTAFWAATGVAVSCVLYYLLSSTANTPWGLGAVAAERLGWVLGPVAPLVLGAGSAGCVTESFQQTLKDVEEPLYELGSRVNSLGTSLLPSSTSTASPRTQVISSETKPIHLLDGSDKLKTNPNKTAELRDSFIIIEKAVWEKDPFLQKDWKELLDLDAEFNALLGSDDAGKDKINQKRKLLENRLKLDMSIEFKSSKVCYTNGDGVKVEVDLSGDLKAKEALEKIVDIYAEAVRENSEEKVRSALQDKYPKEYQDGKVTDIDLDSKTFTLDGVKGKSLEDYIPSMYKEVAERKTMYLQMISTGTGIHLLHKSRKEVDLWAKDLAKKLKDQTGAWFTLTSWGNRFIGKTSELNRAKESVGKAEEKLGANHHTARKVERKTLVSRLILLQVLQRVFKNLKSLPVDQVVSQLDKISTNDFTPAEVADLGLKEVTVDDFDRLKKSLSSGLSKIDCKGVGRALKEPDEKKLKIKNAILKALKERFPLDDPNEWPDLAIVSRALTSCRVRVYMSFINDGSFTESDKPLFKECQEELENECKNIDLDYTQRKWEARKVALQGDSGIELKALEAKASDEHYMKALPASSPILKGVEEKNDITSILEDPLFRSIVALYNTMQYKGSPNAISKLYKDVVKLGMSANCPLSQNQTQYLLDLFATLVEGNSQSEAEYLALVNSLSTLSHRYSIQKRNFGIASKFIS